MSVNHQFTPRGGSTDLAAYSLNSIHHHHHQQQQHELNHKNPSLKLTGRGQAKEFHQTDLNVILESNTHQFKTILNHNQLHSEDFDQDSNNYTTRSNLGPILPPILPYHIKKPLSNHTTTTTTTTTTFINSSNHPNPNIITDQIQIDEKKLTSENFITSSSYPSVYSTNTHHFNHLNHNHNYLTHHINHSNNLLSSLSQNDFKHNQEIKNVSKNNSLGFKTNSTSKNNNQIQERYGEIQQVFPINLSSSSSNPTSNSLIHQNTFEENQFNQTHSNQNTKKINLNHEKYNLSSKTYNLSNHQNLNQLVPDKKHKCEFCFQAFSRRHDRDRHERMHTGEKPYICQECQKGFMRSDALNRHHLIEPRCGKKH